MSVLIRGGLVVAGDATIPVAADVRIVGNRIAAVASGLHAEDATIIDADGALVMPGLIDTHTHSWQYAFRGGLVRGHGFAAYVEQFERYRSRFTAQDSYDAVRGCSLAQLDAGITGVADFVHGANSTAEHVHATFEAHAVTGQRALVALGNTATTSEIADPARFEASRLERLDLVRQLAAEQTSLLHAGLALLTPTDTAGQRVCEEIDYGRSLGVQMGVHQNRPGEITFLYESGRLGPDLMMVHSNTANAREVDMLAETATPLSTTPESEIGAGWSPHVIRRAFRRGIRVGLGIDTPSTQPVDLWQQLRVLDLLLNSLDSEAARTVGRYPIDTALDPSTITFEGILEAATAGGAACMWNGEDVLGVLTPGALADVIVLRPRDVDLALEDPAPYLVQCGSPDQVEAVVVDGAIRKKDSTLVGVDPDELASANHAVRGRVMNRA